MYGNNSSCNSWLTNAGIHYLSLRGITRKCALLSHTHDQSLWTTSNHALPLVLMINYYGIFIAKHYLPWCTIISHLYPMTKMTYSTNDSWWLLIGVRKDAFTSWLSTTIYQYQPSFALLYRWKSSFTINCHHLPFVQIPIIIHHHLPSSTILHHNEWPHVSWPTPHASRPLGPPGPTSSLSTSFARNFATDSGLGHRLSSFGVRSTGESWWYDDGLMVSDGL